MKTILLTLALLCVSPQQLWANAGIFSGAGANLSLSESDQLQMQSEVVKITPLVNDKPIDMSGRNRWAATYECTFTLKNLSKQNQTPKIGFPLTGDGRIGSGLRIMQNSGFSAISQSLSHGTSTHYTPQHIPYDKEKEFSDIYYWDMPFKSKESLSLQINYKLEGYLGMGNLRKDRKDYSRPTKLYQDILDHTIAQIFFYVTKTGGTWAKEIEKATFIVDLREFDTHIHQKCPYDFGEKPEREKIAILTRLWQNGKFFRSLPANFKDQGDKLFVGEFAPFTPGEQFEIGYYLTTFPKDLAGLHTFLQAIEELYTLHRKDKGSRYDKEQLFTPQDKADLADIILEFYGISRNNPNIQNYVEKFIYYQADYPPSIDAALKAKLLEMSEAI